uniref:Uncharacterized protein n=1 Tax=Oryza sativa subsp. japonica TaxID=39947 RepID=Q6ZJA4_ORYSJ|nr:hypothetical protein [Oryza sativa Japonica Group]
MQDPRVSGTKRGRGGGMWAGPTSSGSKGGEAPTVDLDGRMADTVAHGMVNTAASTVRIGAAASDG